VSYFEILIENNLINSSGGLMAKNKYKEKHMDVPIENHDTAAWANTSKMKPKSKVNIPDEVQVRNAKEYVDTNQK